MVLLKHENTALPILRTDSSKIAVVGPQCDVKFNTAGFDSVDDTYSWSAMGFHVCSPYFIGGSARVLTNSRNYKSLLDQMKEEYGNDYVKYFDDAADVDDSYAVMVTCQWACASEEIDGNRIMEDKMKDIDAATVDGNDKFFGVHGNISKVIDELPANLSIKTIAVVYGRPQQEIAHFENKVDAILMQSYGGEKTAEGMVDCISGTVNPNAKLIASLPSPNNPGNRIDESATTVTYDYTQLYADFKHFRKHADYKVGFGMSYTSFNKTCTEDLSAGEVTCVKNTGNVTGKEVVFMHPTGHEEYKLVDFQKTRLLKPGETDIVKLTTKEYKTYISSYLPGIQVRLGTQKN